MKKILVIAGILFAIYLCSNVLFSESDDSSVDHSLPGEEGRVIECSSCHGSTVCSNCNGEGFRNGRRCLSCNGDGKCGVCSGKGVHEVYVINGVDYIECITCHGSGKCNMCSGDGQEDWGYYSELLGWVGYGDCSNCNASGRCRYCHGEGYTKLSGF